MTSPSTAARDATFLIVAHGSRSRRWVDAQRQWFAGVEARLAKSGVSPRFCFLEITEPLLENVLREADGTAEEVIVLPFFLSKSGHVGEEIPEFIAETLKQSRGRLLDVTGEIDALLGRNAARRLREAGARPDCPVIVSGYGSSNNDAQWRDLVARVHRHSQEFRDAPWHWAPAGHFLEDYAAPLREEVRTIQAAGGQRAAILPLYLSISSYQETLIPGVIDEFPEMQLDFQPTAVLPDEQLEGWAAERILREREGQKQEEPSS